MGARVEELSGNRLDLMRILAAAGSVKDEIELHNLVYVGQMMGEFSTTYRFDFALNVPYSSELSRDLQELIESGLIIDTGSAESLFVSNHSSAILSEFPNRPLVGRLAAMERGSLLCLAKLLYQHLEENVDKNHLLDKARQVFLLDEKCLTQAFTVLAARW